MKEQGRTTDAPKVIRGHHLEAVWHLQNGASPKDIADMISNGKDAAPIPQDIKELVNEGAYFSSLPGAYRYDLMGETPEEAAEFHTKNEALYEEYKAMPNDTEVTLVIGKPDDMCGNCKFGNHCKEPNDGRDRNYVQTFRNVVSQLDLNDQLQVQEVERTDKLFSQKTHVITTSADVVRQVLTGDTFKEELKQVQNNNNFAMLRRLGKELAKQREAK